MRPLLSFIGLLLIIAATYLTLVIIIVGIALIFIAMPWLLLVAIGGYIVILLANRAYE